MYLYINSDITHKSPPTHLPIDRSILHAYLCRLSEGNYIDPSTKLYYNFIFYVTRLRISPFYLAEVRWKDVEDNFDGHLNKSLFIKKKIKKLKETFSLQSSRLQGSRSNHSHIMLTIVGTTRFDFPDFHAKLTMQYRRNPMGNMLCCGQRLDLKL